MYKVYKNNIFSNYPNDMRSIHLSVPKNSAYVWLQLILKHLSILKFHINECNGDSWKQQFPNSKNNREDN